MSEQKLSPEEVKKIVEGYYNNCFKTQDGKRVLKDLVKRLGLFSPSLVTDNIDSKINIEKTIYNDARRTVILDILRMLPTELKNEVIKYD